MNSLCEIDLVERIEFEMLLTRRDAKVTRIFKDAIEKAEDAVKTLKKKKRKKKKKEEGNKEKKIKRAFRKTPPGGWDMLEN